MPKLLILKRIFKGCGQNITPAISIAHTSAKQRKGGFSSILPYKSHRRPGTDGLLTRILEMRPSNFQAYTSADRGELRRTGMRLSVNKQSLSTVPRPRHSGLNKTDIVPTPWSTQSRDNFA